ncbi:MAG: DUF928 domain-containing protein [Leptolyngbyaceae cyanobacterium bins.349]|nr:DUF928 domain-containing protein [Leptolyngbyaceae cyanobacterium bins.349]
MATLRTLKCIATGSALAMTLQAVSFLAVEPRVNLEPLGTLELVAPAAAQSKGITYRPPNRLTRAIRTGGTGARGCTNLPGITLMPLVPSNHIGQTLAQRPTFLAYAAGVTAVEFTLVEPNVQKPLWVQTVKPDAQGMVRVELPTTAPELDAGKMYRWSVAVICNPNRRSQDVFAQSWIQRVEPSSELNQRLKAAGSAQEKARIYAETGFWYDAIALLAKENQTNPANSAVRADLSALLEQVNLANLVIRSPQTTQVVKSQPAQ